MNAEAYALVRVIVGMSMFGHGLVRVPKLAAFSAWMVGKFTTSILPEALVVPFSYALPILELTVGALLLVGLFTRGAAIVGGLVMLALIFGTTTIENFDALPSQMIHAAFLAVVLQHLASNRWSLDHAIAARRAG